MKEIVSSSDKPNMIYVWSQGTYKIKILENELSAIYLGSVNKFEPDIITIHGIGPFIIFGTNIENLTIESLAR